MDGILVDYVNDALIFLDGWGIVIVIVFGVLHPLISQPLHLFNLTLAIGLVGALIGFPVVIVSNIIGIILLWYFTRIARKSNVFKRWNVSEQIFTWVNNTEPWRHAVVIGAPTIPTYPIKLAIPLSGMSFKEYFKTLMGSYAVLIISNTLIYYGLVGFLTDNIPPWGLFLIMLVIVLYVYFGRRLFDHGRVKKTES